MLIAILYLLTGIGLYALIPFAKRPWWKATAIICLWLPVQAAVGAICLAVLLASWTGDLVRHVKYEWLGKGK